MDTYWSDHCRHLTFETELKHLTFQLLNQKQLQATCDKYIAMRDSGTCRNLKMLMDMATIFGRYERANGRWMTWKVSDKINTCSVESEVDVNGERTMASYVQNETQPPNGLNHLEWSGLQYRWGHS